MVRVPTEALRDVGTLRASVAVALGVPAEGIGIFDGDSTVLLPDEETVGAERRFTAGFLGIVSLSIAAPEGDEPTEDSSGPGLAGVTVEVDGAGVGLTDDD